MRKADLIAGGFGLHYFGSTAGLVVSVAALVFAWLLHWAGGLPLVLIGTVAIAYAVVWAAPRATVPLITDIFIGQLVALWTLSGGLWFAGVAPHIFPWPGFAGGFIMFTLFRFLPPIRSLAKRHPLLDDLVAGLLASSLTLLSAAASHGWLG